MRLFQHYVISRIKEALASIDVPETTPTADPSQPAVAPADAVIFPENVTRQLEFYKEKALLVQDFEGFQALLEQAAVELGLNPAQDLGNIASIFNLYRTQAGENPL